MILAAALLALCPLLVAQTAQSPEAVAIRQTTLSQAVPAQISSQDTLLDGTAVKLQLSMNLSSADAHSGDQVPFEVLEDVNVYGVAVIKKGTTAIGLVTDAEHKKSMGRAGKLDVSLSFIRLADQEKVALRATNESKGAHRLGTSSDGMTIMTAAFPPAAVLMLFPHGKDIIIHQGTQITAFVDGDVHLNMDKFKDVPATIAPMAIAPPPPAPVSLVIDSTPAGADIEIDGAFVGNTPSTVSVAPGSHQIVVIKKGYKIWLKSLDAAGGTMPLNAELEHIGPP
jgi:hypothetical protein